MNATAHVVTVLASPTDPANPKEWVIFLIPFATIALGTFTAMFVWLNNRSKSDGDDYKEMLRDALKNDRADMLDLRNDFRSLNGRFDFLGERLDRLIEGIHDRRRR